MFVQVNASLFCMEPLCVVNVTTGRCEPKVAVCPPWAGGDGSVVESGPGGKAGRTTGRGGGPEPGAGEAKAEGRTVSVEAVAARRAARAEAK